MAGLEFEFIGSETVKEIDNQGATFRLGFRKEGLAFTTGITLSSEGGSSAMQLMQ
jgi:hypothetical protein